MQERKIRNLVFDIGNVLVHFRVDDMIRSHGYDEETVREFQRCVLEDPLWSEFDLENMSFDEVVDEYAARYPHIADVIRWFMSHTELMTVPRQKIWEMVRSLKSSGYRIYLLSNYSSEFFRTQIAVLPFMEAVDGKVISYEIHRIKPDRAIYEELVTRYDLKKEECLFFDDRLENVEAAKAFGMEARQVFSQEQLLEMLEKCMAQAADL